MIGDCLRIFTPRKERNRELGENTVLHFGIIYYFCTSSQPSTVSINSFFLNFIWVLFCWLFGFAFLYYDYYNHY